ncbi:PAS domain-containing protein [Pelagibius litoralis]|uniref:PAS domain-containing protein n=1 Tax=Pelagibius litoralis TaxID=374515 RepID=A0A967EX70_9PROT|nr:PAS domain-containing protein [Pelagibius litoralis]NIA68015.1 PAS domain-containing protein [Pelagibius litoralis]
MTLNEDFHRIRHGLPARSTSRAFLDHCPERIAEIFHYWDGLRGDRRMPCRADFDPAKVVHHLPSLLLIDVEGVDDRGNGILRYRVVGTEEVQIRGHDPTGKLVSEGYFGPSLEAVTDTYELVRREGRFLFELLEFKTPRGALRCEFVILLPLSEDGANVSQILVYSLVRHAADED